MLSSYEDNGWWVIANQRGELYPNTLERTARLASRQHERNLGRPWAASLLLGDQAVKAEITYEVHR